jgi:site-specific recombinase XerD
MKGKKQGRHVMLNPAAKEAIRHWLTAFERIEEPLAPDDYLFKSRTGANRPLSRQWAWKVLKVAYVAADVHGPTGCHSTRKSFAERAFVELGRDLHHLQAVMSTAQLARPSNISASIVSSSIEPSWQPRLKAERYTLSLD